MKRAIPFGDLGYLPDPRAEEDLELVLERVSERQDLERARLTEEQIVIWYLRKRYDCSFGKISKITHKSKSTVKTQYKRAWEKLKAGGFLRPRKKRAIWIDGKRRLY